MSDYIPIILSIPISGGGASPAATFAFMTSGYRPPAQGRTTAQEIVHNRNGIFKFRYDNGPNVYVWTPFQLVLMDAFGGMGSAAEQWERLLALWNYKEGPLGMRAPEGEYTVDWATQQLERQFIRYPGAAGDKQEFYVVVNFEEG